MTRVARGGRCAARPLVGDGRRRGGERTADPLRGRRAVGEVLAPHGDPDSLGGGGRRANTLPATRRAAQGSAIVTREEGVEHRAVAASILAHGRRAGWPLPAPSSPRRGSASSTRYVRAHRGSSGGSGGWRLQVRSGELTIPPSRGWEADARGLSASAQAWGAGGVLRGRGRRRAAASPKPRRGSSPMRLGVLPGTSWRARTGRRGSSSKAEASAQRGGSPRRRPR